MQRISVLHPITCASIVIAVIIATVTDVTYAALQSQQSKFTGSTIQTATANLLVSQDGTVYSTSQTGFMFSNVIPGGSLTPSNGHPFHLKKTGGTALSLKLAVSSTPANVDNVDLTKVNVLITPQIGQTQSFTPQSLIDSYATGGTLLTNYPVLYSGYNTQFTIQVSMAKDAFSGFSATIGTIGFSFTGVTVI